MIHQIKSIIKRVLGLTPKRWLELGISQREYDLIASIRAKKLTYLSEERLSSLVKACRSIEESNINGMFVEAGCALGGSSILLASLKKSDRPFSVYDVFGMIPPPTAEDTPDVHNRYKVIVEGKSEGISGDKYYGYENDLYELVQTNFKNFNININEKKVSLIKGLLQDTMRIDQPISLAHIDVDWYDPVLFCLKQVFPNLSVGGCIILDDYHDWGGCRKATDEYLLQVQGQYSLDDSAGSMKITRKRGNNE